MVIKEVLVENQVGLHARPATFFIQRANEYKSSIWVEKDVYKRQLQGVDMALPRFNFCKGAARQITAAYLKPCSQLCLCQALLFPRAPDALSNPLVILITHGHVCFLRAVVAVCSVDWLR